MGKIKRRLKIQGSNVLSQCIPKRKYDTKGNDNSHDDGVSLLAEIDLFGEVVDHRKAGDNSGDSITNTPKLLPLFQESFSGRHGNAADRRK